MYVSTSSRRLVMMLILGVGCAASAHAQVVAYVDLNSNDVFDAGDRLIFQVVDVDGSGTVTVGDRVDFGYFPPTPASTASNGPTANTPLTVTGVTTCASWDCEIVLGDFEVRFGIDALRGREWASFIESEAFVGGLADNDTYVQDDRTWLSESLSTAAPFGDLARVPDTYVEQPGDQDFFDLAFGAPVPVELQHFSVE